LLIAGFLLKAQCITEAGWDGRQYTRLCYNDIQALYGARLLDKDTFPYVNGSIGADGLQGGAIEYPVLTGVFMWATAEPVDHVNDYWKISAFALAPFALLAAYFLARDTGWRALLWAGAPALALYAFHNWDLLAVAASVIGFYLWRREKPGWAAFSFAIGAALKLYPAVFVLPLIFDVAFRRRPEPDGPEEATRAGRLDLVGAIRTASIAAGTWLAINLPFMLKNFDGWYATYRFHEERTSNYDSIWTKGWPAWGPDKLNLVTTGLTLGSVIVILAVGWLRARKDGTYPLLQVSGALLAAVMLWGKVQSPQYTLWILPFFALLRVSLMWWAAYSIVDLMVYVGIFKWFGDQSDTRYESLWVAGVWGRAALLAVLIVVFLISQPSEPELSHPPPNLQPNGDRLPAQA
jgi:uncharacterized membrane protein